MSDQPPSYGPPGDQPPEGQPYGGQPQGQPYGQQYGGQPYGGAPRPDLAQWIQRVGASIIDGLLLVPGYILYFIGSPSISYSRTTGFTQTSSPGVLYYLGALVILAVGIWNYVIKQGRTGQTVGKGVLGIALVREADGQPVGPGLAFGRGIVHILDIAPCLIGFLWPLWDRKNQTFADKVVSTVVITSH